MKVAVVTPYHREPEDWLRRCHESVRAQRHPCTHILVADGRPNPLVESFDVQHIRLPRPHGDYGDTPRALGALSAIAQGFEAIAFLDADNWYKPGHIASLVALHEETGAAVCTAVREFRRLDGSVLGVCPYSDGELFVDTSCFFLTAAAFAVVPELALMPKPLHTIGDRVLLYHIKRLGLPRAHSWRATLCYRGTSNFEYELFGEMPPPEAAKTRSEVGEALRWAAANGWPDLSCRTTVEHLKSVRPRILVEPD